jgi:FkbM family methyltransferase
LDIGANIGAFSLWSRYKWPHSTIYAYEPHPEVFKILEHNTGWLPRMQRFNTAVGDVTKTRLYECPGSRTCGSQLPMDNKTVSMPIAVINPGHLPHADVVKIDVEGAEMDILSALWFSPAAVMVEWHSQTNRLRVDEWASAAGLHLVKLNVHRADLGVSIFVKEVA